MSLNIAALLNIPFKIAQNRLIEDLAVAGYGDIRAAHGAVFAYLGKDGEMIATLARRSQQSKQAIHKLVVYLEERGYVNRVDHDSDGRANLVILTEKGRAAVIVAEKSIAQTEAMWEKKLSPKRMAALRQTLTDLIQ
ncbi:MAG: MarR family winged helix-turn-helix transcriptional regulator [Saprospiraceae bacterium]